MAETEKKPKTVAATKPDAKATAAAGEEKAATKAPAKAPAKGGAAATSGAAKKASEKADAADSATKATAPKAAPKAAAKAKPEADAAGGERVRLLKVHHLRPAPGAKTERTRVGRGEASKGKTAGRGTKGTKARYQVRVGLEGGNLNQVMRAPKLRGFTNPFRVEYQVVNLEKLASLYPKGGDVTVADLVAKGVVRKNERVKVLGSGDIAVKLTVAVDKVSGSAQQKIEAAGGTVK